MQWTDVASCMPYSNKKQPQCRRTLLDLVSRASSPKPWECHEGRLDGTEPSRRDLASGLRYFQAGGCSSRSSLSSAACQHTNQTHVCCVGAGCESIINIGRCWSVEPSDTGARCLDRRGGRHTPSARRLGRGRRRGRLYTLLCCRVVLTRTVQDDHCLSTRGLYVCSGGTVLGIAHDVAAAIIVRPACKQQRLA